MFLFICTCLTLLYALGPSIAEKPQIRSTYYTNVIFILTGNNMYGHVLILLHEWLHIRYFQWLYENGVRFRLYKNFVHFNKWVLIKNIIFYKIIHLCIQMCLLKNIWELKNICSRNNKFFLRSVVDSGFIAYTHTCECVKTLRMVATVRKLCCDMQMLGKYSGHFLLLF